MHGLHHADAAREYTECLEKTLAPGTSAASRGARSFDA